MGVDLQNAKRPVAVCCGLDERVGNRVLAADGDDEVSVAYRLACRLVDVLKRLFRCPALCLYRLGCVDRDAFEVL